MYRPRMSMSRLSAAVVTVVALAAAGSGCAYLRDRGADFADQTSVGVGAGLGASVRATNFVQSGLGFTIISFRTMGRKILPPFGVTGEASFFLAPIFHYRSVTSSAFQEESRLVMLGCTLLEPEDESKWTRWGDPSSWSFLPDRTAYAEGFDRRFWDIGFSAYLGAGLEFDINLYEIADFWLGWFGLDISGDDGGGSKRSAKETSTESS